MHKYNVGDVVEVVANDCNHAYKIGTLVTIIEQFNIGSDGVVCYDTTGLDTYGDIDDWFVYETDVKKPHSEEQGCDH